MNSALRLLAVSVLVTSEFDAQQAAMTRSVGVQHDELTCLAALSPFAELRLSSARRDSSSHEGGLVVRIGPRDSLGANPQVMLFGANSGGGGAFDSTGTVLVKQRTPGIHQLGVRATLPQVPWRYAVTVRPGVVDTVVINLNARCTRVAASQQWVKQLR